MPKPRERQPRTELRIEHVAGLMRAFRYETGKTSRELAAKWNLSLKTVETYTAEASRRVRAEFKRELEDPEGVRIDVAVTLRVIMHRARAAVVAKKPDWAAARVGIDAAKTWAAVSGVAASAKHDVTHHGDFRTAREALDYVRGLIPELEEQAANDAEPAKGAA